MSQVIYNGVTLPYPLTTSFVQEAVHDDAPGGIPTDWILTKFDITVQCIINVDYLALLAPDLFLAGIATTQNPADIMKVIRSRLLTQRKTLSYSFNGKELLPVRLASNNGEVDARNGPVPQSCNIMEMTNTTFLVTYHIVAHYWENNYISISTGNLSVLNRATGPVLFNRWTETVDFDNCQFATRTRDGKFMIRSDNAQGVIADHMRDQMAVVSVPEGFLRANSKYTVSPDGLAISYTVVDKETYKMPPKPAFEAEGEYTESCSRLGAVRYADIRIKLKGDNSRRLGKDTQNQLILASFAVVSRKLRMRGAGILLEKGQKEPNGILESFSIRVWMYENIVECSARVMFKFNGELLFSSPRGSSFITYTPLSDDVKNYTPEYRSRGTSNMLLQAAAYYDPSLNEINVSLKPGLPNVGGKIVTVGNKAVQMPNGALPGQAGEDGE